jgi:hypothetical protein
MTTPGSDLNRSRVAWHISSRSGSGGAQCVEAGPVLDGSGRVAVRHSKRPAAEMLVCSGPAWTAFVGLITAE